MERRRAIRSLGVLSFAFIPCKLLGDKGSTSIGLKTDAALPMALARCGNLPAFRHECYVAAREDYWNEPKRALDAYKAALVIAPGDLPSEAIADISDAMHRFRQDLEKNAQELDRMQFELTASPHDPEKNFRAGYALTRLGQEEEALKYHQTALRFLGSMDRLCQADCLNHIGWYYYRHRDSRQALTWFDRVIQLDDGSVLVELITRRAIENKLLACANLRMEREVRATLNSYISRFGRLAWPERDILKQINIDSDAVYLRHPHRSALAGEGRYLLS